MAYVPGFESDLFVSYAHADDLAWVNAFEKSLREELGRTLGCEVHVWQDAKKIRLGQNWQAEIAQGIQKAATFVAIVSPSYKNSDWCMRERKVFIDSLGTMEALEKSNRFLKIIKKPWDNDSHLEFLPKLQHLSYYRRPDGPAREMEFVLGSEEFRLSLAQTVAAIAEILRTMRRHRERLFVASPAPDCLDYWEALRKELLSQSYDVQPEGRRDSTFSDKLVRGEMESALLSIHLLGGTYDAFGEHQIDLAAELERRLVFWFPEEAERTADERQRILLGLIRNGRRGDNKELPRGWALLVEKSPWKLSQEILAMLKPQREAPPFLQRTKAGAHVYLLCDPTTREDTAFAAGLQKELRDKEGMEVFLPQADLPSAADFTRQHQTLLRDCDGVLLYRDVAPEQWLLQTVPQVLFAERLVNRPPLRSKAMLLSDPAPWEGHRDVKVIARTAGFQLKDLEPFLIPLRAHGG
jgi:hypothetical protein